MLGEGRTVNVRDLGRSGHETVTRTGTVITASCPIARRMADIATHRFASSTAVFPHTPASSSSFVTQPTCVLDKKDENVERTWRERNSCLVSQETPLRRLEAERAESVGDHREPAEVVTTTRLYE